MKPRLAVLFLLCCGLIGQAAIARVANNSSQFNGAAGTTSAALNTTGSSLLVIVVSGNYGNTSALTVSDSKGNTWHYAAGYATNVEDPYKYTGVWYSYDHGGSALSVGSGHTATVSGNYSAIFHFIAYSGTLTTGDPYDQHNGAGYVSQVAPPTGTITPSVDNCVVVVGLLGNNSAATISSIDGGFTLGSQTSESTDMNAGFADLVQTTKTAANPTWSLTHYQDGSTVSVSFKPAATVAPAIKGNIIQW